MKECTKIKKLVFCFLLILISIGSLTVSSAAGDIFYTESEDNGFHSSANIIKNDYTVSASVCEFDMDFYEFTLPSTSNVTVTCIADYSCLLYGVFNVRNDCLATGSYVKYTSNGHEFSLSVSLDAGTYYLAFFNEGGITFNNSYTFHFERIIINHTHSYSYDCDTTCDTCGDSRNALDHKYDNSCDTECNICGDIRDITHAFKWVIDKIGNCGKDGSKHQECTVCLTKQNENTVIKATGKHIYDNACDTSCNVCGNIRTVGSHMYDSGKITKTASCKAAGVKTYTCSVCKSTKTETIAKSNHTYSNNCDKFCDICGATRSVGAHKYTNSCDTTCDYCGAKRTIKHKYSNNCDKTCNICGATRITGAHKYTNSCDTTCDYCGAKRTIKHKYSNNCDRSCNVCGVTRSVGPHKYSYSCDATCNVCNAKRTIKHKYTNSCDTKCNVCGATRTIKHTYSNNCDKSCNVCGKTRTVRAHKYTNSCDTTCNYCNAKRTIKHTYSSNCDTSCNVCKATRTVTHAYKTTTTKATLTKSGSIVRKCTVCGNIVSKTLIKYANTFKLSAMSYTYNGKVKTPTVTVKDANGKKLKVNTDYTVTFASGRKSVGTYKVTIKMIGKYSGTRTMAFKIIPKAASVNTLIAGSKKLTVKLNRSLKQSTGYQIQYSTSKSFKNAKTKTITSYKTNITTLTGLKAKNIYYIRVRTYKTVGKTNYYSNWSNYKYKKTK